MANVNVRGAIALVKNQLMIATNGEVEVMNQIGSHAGAKELSDVHTESALETVRTEIRALEALEAALRTADFSEALHEAVMAIASTKGRVVVCGMGKSGHIGQKIAATFRSTGTPALFLHPGEASHGDLGLITADDVVFAITWSGETKELSDIFNYCKLLGIPLIVATAHRDSTAARASCICLALPLVREACPNDLAPTSSTTVQLVLGDMLAVALIEARGFGPSDFRAFHPGGRLGEKLITVDEIMGKGESVPVVGPDESLGNATIEISRKRYGATAIVDDHGRLLGAFTDGDLRRCISVYDLNAPIMAHMSTRPVTVQTGTLCSEALRIMNENAVSVIFVMQQDRLAGVVHIHDIVRAGIV